MVLDTSALIAILLGEPETPALAYAIANDPVLLLSAFSALETAIVIEARKGPTGGREYDLLLHKTQIQIVNINAEQVALARDAYSRFGKGRHAAGLNLGDCCAYALAGFASEPLLYKGNNFSKTDIASVPYDAKNE